MRRRCAAATWVLIWLAAALPAWGQEADQWKAVADTGPFSLKPKKTRTIEFALDPMVEGRRVAVAFRAFARSKEVGGYRPAVHITVNGQYMRTNLLNRPRLLNKPIEFRFGLKGERRGTWGEDSRWKSVSFEGSALWTVCMADALDAIAKSREYAPKGLKDPATLIIDISDLIRPGRKNVVRIHNDTPDLTLEFDFARIQADRSVPYASAREMDVLRRKRRRKSECTYYTPERIAIGRENVKRYKWAQELFRRIMKGDRISYYTGAGKYVSANDFAAQSDEFMWLLQPTTKLPRHVLRGSKPLHCPIHGWEGRKAKWPGAAWCPWRIDPIKHPYKVQCLAGGEWLPTNDWHKGDMTSGEFPDDGSGILYKGKRYRVLQEYAHMVYGSVVIPCLRSLSQAYVLTGDRTYAHKGCILLARLASEYPNHEFRRDRLYDQRPLRRYRGRGTGMITDDIWECRCLEETAYAYDAFFDYMDNDPALLQFLKSKGLPVETADDLRAYIEDNLIRAGMKALLLKMICGNEGYHQAAAMACALVIDDFADVRVNTQHMVDYYYHGVGQAAYILSNGLTPDGGGHESPNYNRIKFNIIRAARLMEEIRKRHPDRFPKDRYPDIFGTPKAHAMFDYFIDVFMLDQFIPAIGDCSGIERLRRQEPRRYCYNAKDYLFAFQRYGDLRYARACTRPDGTFVEGELFEPYPADAINAALKKPESQIVRAPRFLDDYGLAILESGEGDHRRAVYLNYLSWPNHRQCENLSIGFFARGVDWLPDLGYPYTYTARWQWDSNSMAHNTVTVDETPPSRKTRGMGRLFASVDGVHVVTASHDPYPPDHEPTPAHFQKFRKGAKPCNIYERTLMLVDVDPQRFYVVDLFAVNGGEQHDQSWHGPLVSVQVPELNWQVQPQGTLAGPEVALFGRWTDRWGRKREDFPSFLAKIRRAQLAKPAVWTWNSGLPEGDALQLHLVPVGGPMEVIVGTGHAPARPKDWGLDYVIARRRAEGGRRSLFLTVLDAFQKAPVVREVRLLSEKPLQVAIVREDGQDEITFTLPDAPSRTTAFRPLGVRIRSRTGATVTRDVRIGACGRDGHPGYAKSIIRELDYATNRIGVAAVPGLEKDLAPGRVLRVFNAHRSALYRVLKTVREEDVLWITLDRTAQLGRAPVTEVGDGTLTLGARFIFANSGLDKEGRLLPARGGDRYRGSWVGDEKRLLQVRAIGKKEWRGTSARLFLEKSISASTLREWFRGRTVSLWQYGLGDRVEAARIAR